MVKSNFLYPLKGGLVNIIFGFPQVISMINRVVNMSIYAIVSSDSSLQLYPENKAYHFKCHLNTHLHLEGVWRVALLEANVSAKKQMKTLKPLCVYSNICGESIVDGDQEPLLRKLQANSPNNWDVIFEAGHYMPLKINNIADIDIYITTREGVLASFLDQPSSVTLHFKAFLFILVWIYYLKRCKYQI